MTDFTVTITDPDQLAGITWAREEHNKTIPPVPPPELPPEDAMAMEDEPMPTPQAEILATDQDYVQWVMENAAISYADQKLRKEYQDHYEANAAAQQEEMRRRRAS